MEKIQTVKDLLDFVKKRDPDQQEFLQAFEEVVKSLKPLLESDRKYLQVMYLMSEPERTIIFRVPWVDDKGVLNVNRGFRVQFNGAIGPFKGGLRFHPSVNLSIVKFLGFEQILKNALTTLPMGGAKGGSDFDPKGKSDIEVMRFCQSFMNELFRHIGPNTDVPAGDIGVGEREIGYLFGQYKKLKNEWNGVITGKGKVYGGSLLRPEATGYGVVMFAEEMLKVKNITLKGKRVCVSGSGNVAQYCVERLIDSGAIAITVSDSDGYIFEPEGINKKQLDFILKLKNQKRGRIKEYLSFSKTAKYFSRKKPWGEKCDIVMPCACENEIDLEDAKALKASGCWCVVEGSNMPSTAEAIEFYHKNGIIYGPSKAANAGGVSTSGLEMTQNSIRLQWSREEVAKKLKDIMGEIHKVVYDTSKMLGDEGNYQIGANAAGFLKVAEAMIDEGIV